MTKALSLSSASLLGALAAAVALRLAGIHWGLPNTLNSDEPHLVNLAVSFGAGTLRPYALKYPTFWPYVLFAAYGAYFLVWSGFGLRRGVADFAGWFAWHPGPFYLIGRLLSAAFSLAAVALIYREEQEHDPRAVPWAALALAVSPVAVELAHSAKPDCLMFLCACLGWRYALRVQRDGGRRAHWLSGLGFGLAAASQYTAAPAFITLVVAHFLSRQQVRRRWLLEGAAAAVVGLFLAAPYVLLDWARVVDGMRDMQALMALKSYSARLMVPLVLGNAWNFAGQGSIAGLAALLGLALLLRREAGRALTLAAAPLLYIALLSLQKEGGWARYMLAAFPGMALLAAAGLEWARARFRSGWATAALLLLFLGPGAAIDVDMDRRMRLADTRAEAAAWLGAHVPPGATLLLDLPHASPDMPMTKAQALELAERTRAAGSPRARLYRGLADAHPGGGYRLLRLQRTARDLASGPRHVRLSQADAPMLDVQPGLSAARAAGVDYVVTSDFGATRAILPELSLFFDELEAQGRLLASFTPRPDESAGPTLRVFALPR